MFEICVEIRCEFGVFCVEEVGFVYCVCLIFICLGVNVIKVRSGEWGVCRAVGVGRGFFLVFMFCILGLWVRWSYLW